MDSNRFLTSRVFTDIVNGYSQIKIGMQTVYIMHMSPFQESEIEEVRLIKYEEAVKHGLFTEQGKMALLKKEKMWSDDQDQELAELQYYITSLKNTKGKLMFLSQIKQHENLILEKEAEYYSKWKNRAELLGLTAEKYADRKASNHYLYCSLYLDNTFSKRYFTRKKFDNLDDDDINDLIVKFNKGLELLEDINLKKTALATFVQNLYNLNDNPFYFLGKPVSSFTYYQINLCYYAAYYKNVLAELGENVPIEYRNDPEKIDNLFISSNNVQNQERKNSNSNGVGGFFGATEEDLKALGKNPNETDKLSKALKEKGEFDIYDVIKMGL